jgi:hypothetical protein
LLVNRLCRQRHEAFAAGVVIYHFPPNFIIHRDTNPPWHPGGYFFTSKSFLNLFYLDLFESRWNRETGVQLGFGICGGDIDEEDTAITKQVGHASLPTGTVSSKPERFWNQWSMPWFIRSSGRPRQVVRWQQPRRQPQIGHQVRGVKITNPINSA